MIPLRMQQKDAERWLLAAIAVIDSEIAKGSVTDKLIISLKKVKEEGAKVGPIMGMEVSIVSPETKLERQILACP